MHKLYRILIVIIIACLVLLYTVNFDFMLDVRRHLGGGTSTWNWANIRREQDATARQANNDSYFVDTTGCRMPSFPVSGPSVDKFWSKPTAPGACSLALTQSNTHGAIWVAHNRSVLRHEFGLHDADGMRCTVTPIVRRSDSLNEFEAAMPLYFGEVVHVRAAYVRVMCDFTEVSVTNGVTVAPTTAPTTTSQATVKEHTTTRHHLPVKAKRRKIVEYHYFIQVPSERKRTTCDNATATTIPENSNKINVLILGIDSVSRLNFYRQMPRTVDRLLNRLHAVDLLGYNKVEDNTYPNLVAALSGLEYTELAATCLPNANSTFDACNFIWDMYAESGYTTVFAEDMARLGTFNYLRPGFRRQPADFVLRPLIAEMEKHVAYQRQTNVCLCLASWRPVDILVDYVSKFVAAIRRAPYFAFAWTASFTHDFWNFPQLIDDKVVALLDQLDTSPLGGRADFASGIRSDDNDDADTAQTPLNNTFLLLMSDHGLRWGPFRNTYQGMMEERQPFLFLVPPPWFPDRYPAAYLNLLQNRRRLTTHFDLYETLRDLLEPDASLSAAVLQQRNDVLLAMEPMPRGISLFLHVPERRTCMQAGISPHWCTCHERQPMLRTNARVQRVARFIVKQINVMVRPFHRCQTLALNSIEDATLASTNVDVIGNRTKTVEHFADVTVRLRTKPGLGEFEATVRMHGRPDTGTMTLAGTISRTNLYGRQSECVNDARIKLYCFCDSFM